MARLNRAEMTQLDGLMQKCVWTDADIDTLLGLTAVESLTFPAGTLLPSGALGRFAPLTALRAVILDGCPVGDADIAQLAMARPELRRLHVTGTKITDAALPTIGKSFPRLEQLHIGQTAITNKGLPYLTPLSYLEYLWVDGTTVTDAGLLSLAPARRLTSVNVQKTAVTPAGKDAHLRAWFAARRGPKATPPDPADVVACHALLMEFFQAMNAWEPEAARAMEIRTQNAAESEKRRAHLQEQEKRVAEIFDRFLTARPRRGERDQVLHVSKPLTYSAVQFFDAERVSRDRVNIITKEPSQYRLYTCVRTPEGWRIDAKKWLGGGGWKRDFF